MNARCWFLAICAIAACLLIFEAKKGDHSPDYQTYPEMVEQHNSKIEEAVE